MSSQVLAKPRSVVREGLVLTERDTAILCALMLFGALLPAQVHELFFPGCTRRRCNQRLQQLAGAGLIVFRPVPLGVGGDCPETFHAPHLCTLGAKAAPRVAEALGMEVEAVRRVARQGTPSATAHTLEIADFWLSFRRAARYDKPHSPEGSSIAPQSGAHLPGVLRAAGSGWITMEFRTERQVRHSYQVRAACDGDGGQKAGQWRPEVFKPDGLLKIAWGGGSWRHFFVEVDRGNASTRAWKLSTDIAARYRTLLFPKRYGADAANCHTLITTTGPLRREHLRRLFADHLPAEDAARIALTTREELAGGGPLGAVWHVPGWAQAVSLAKWVDSDKTYGKRNAQGSGDVGNRKDRSK